METAEFRDILAAIIILTIVSSFTFVLDSQWSAVPQIFLFFVIIIVLSVFTKKAIAYALDSDVEHELWKIERYGFSHTSHFKTPKLAGIIIPLFFTLVSLGKFIVMPLLTYETRALKHRAAKRHGFYSYTEMTDFHNALIGASGIVILLILSVVTYLTSFEHLAKLSTFYAFWNLLPISKLDGTQIFFGSRILYSILAVITLIFTIYALIL